MLAKWKKMRYNTGERKHCFMTEVADINIRELASLAGVSIATVSRVINNPQLVQPDTREHVLEVMRRVNYTPAWTVESRLSSRSRLIAFLFSEADYYFYSDIRSGLESIAGLRGYTVLFCPIAAEQQRRSQQLRTIFEQKLDGAIWALRDFYPEDIKMIDERQVPLVLAPPPTATTAAISTLRKRATG